ncbi:hypothetical protein SEA_CARPAL_3 [Arthrobacter phage Carpal]|uniref:Uncharacterized protein n=4 Tax=Korravirus TaxID=1982076 RepID=A0A0U4K0I7_9CAUD|nr:hypothetical protein FDH60_gp03 [Arthrobacter phage Korra]ALY09468.1 hypothetical protein PBI_KORRA_3 [Arthrobacter phage Korra]ASR83448.1 hypothetical protein SEA_DINO_3 [Arthrobacter phage Dino]AZF97380.1 hypothetical protein SEA_CARPAL_3 [Arthrobacter phage Carpal]AZS11451.1 hypothetical protein SEA_ZORRO_3 [Arthrobacter phage Zorro]
MDLHNMTDEQLDQLLNLTLAEQERRQRLKNIPAQVAMLSSQFREGGGDQTELLAAIGG